LWNFRLPFNEHRISIPRVGSSNLSERASEIKDLSTATPHRISTIRQSEIIRKQKAIRALLVHAYGHEVTGLKTYRGPKRKEQLGVCSIAGFPSDSGSVVVIMGLP
jgi:hypothetical protein